MEFSARQVCELLNGELEGDADAKVSSLSTIEQGEPGSITFLYNPQYTSFIYSTRASVVIVNKDFVAEQPVAATIIRVENAYNGLARLLEIYYKLKFTNKSGIEAMSFVSPTAQLGADVYVGAFAYVGNNVKIGNNVKLYPHVYIGDNVEIKDDTILFSGVKVYPNCKIGAGCTVHSGTIIGSDGFGFSPQNDASYKKVWHIGNVIIEDNVEIGANTTIDRATFESTIIRSGAKLDNLIQVAHNVEIGENTVIAAQTGVAGSSKIGKECQIGGQVGIIGHKSIADKVKIAAQSGIGDNIVNEGEVLQGSPAFNYKKYQRSYVLFRKLPELEKRIHELEQALKESNKFSE